MRRSLSCQTCQLACLTESPSADAANSFVGVDLDEGLLDFVSLVVDLATTVAPPVALVAELFVDVGRLEEPVFEEWSVDFHGVQ